jgi:nitrite reductase/ring-hydroxylating ferredoxin subunit
LGTIASGEQDNGARDFNVFRAESAYFGGIRLAPSARMSEARDLALFSSSTRRQFCARAVALVPLAALADACGGGSPSAPNATPLPIVNGTFASNIVTVNIDASSPLSAVGAMALVQTSAGDLLVAHTGANAFTALSATCTHQACEVTGFSGNLFVCPCHGSEYSTGGAVVSGPAPAALHTFASAFANNVLTITVA